VDRQCRRRFWIGVCFGDEAVDGGLEVVDGSDDAAHQATAREFGEEALGAALSQDAEVGVKWKVQRRGCWANHAPSTLGCLWVA
jgi:hypothetical protein